MTNILFYWCSLAIVLLGILIVVIKLLSPTSQDEDVVLDAIEKTFPDSSFSNIYTYIETNTKHKFALVWIYHMLGDLERAGLIIKFTKDGEYHKDKNGEYVIQDDGQTVLIQYYQIIGRKNKNRKARQTDTDSGNYLKPV